MKYRRIGSLVLAVAASVSLPAGSHANALPGSGAHDEKGGSDADRLFSSGYYRQAVQTLQAAIAANPKDASLEYWLGRCYYELQDYNRSIDSLEHAVAMAPDHSEYHDWLGRAYGRKAEETNLFAAFASLGLARKAQHEFASAVRIDPNDLDAQRDLIRYLSNAPGIVGGSEDHAQDQIQALQKVDPIEADLARAELLAKDKRYPEADAKYRTILAAKPTRADSYVEIAEYYRDHADGARLQQATEGGLKIAPDDHRLQYFQGVALVLLKKNPTEAEGDLRNYLNVMPDSSEVPSHASAHEWLGKLYESQGKLDQAVGEYQAALTLDPRNKSLRDAVKRLTKR